MPTVIYILGVGHSGSTLLDAVLAAHPQVFGCGELGRFASDGLRKNHYCACGARVRECSVWSKVHAMWLAHCPDLDLDEYERLARRFEPVRGAFLMLAGRGGADERLFLAWLRGLVGAIATVTERPVLVDSSKGLGRAVALHRALGESTQIWHLVRDGRGVVQSYSRSTGVDEAAGLQKAKRGQPAWRTAFRWAANNTICGVVGWLHLRAHRVHYESFVSDPATVLGAIGARASLDYRGVAQQLLADGVQGPSHTVAGNRLRMQRRIILRHDTHWRNELSFGDRLRFWLIAGPVAIVLGYRP